MTTETIINELNGYKINSASQNTISVYIIIIIGRRPLF